MDKDALRTAEPKDDDTSNTKKSRGDQHEHAISRANASTLESIAAHARPLLMPQPTGAIIGAGGTF